MNQTASAVERVIGFDSHPDSFTAALITGAKPSEAVVEKTFNKIPMAQLKSWAQKHTTTQDTIVLEASGNSFQLARSLQELGRKALVLESCHLGKLKEAHANNDKISAIRIGKAFLAGTARIVWIPDRRTQDRRDWFLAYQKSVKRTTQMINRLDSYLSDNGVRLKHSLKQLEPAQASKAVLSAKEWLPAQKLVLENYLLELNSAQQQRENWQRLLAVEVSTDPMLLSLVRLCGIREVVAFALGAVIGDIARFAEPKKLVKYVGLDPAFDDSGEGTWSGGVGGHGRKDLRSLLIEAAQSILNSKSAMGAWGRRLAAKKNSLKLAVAVVARRLTVAVWYLLQGKWSQLQELDRPLKQKLGKIITSVGSQGLAVLGQTRAQLREQMRERLLKGRVYVIDPDRQYAPKAPNTPKPKLNTLAQEYGLA